MLIVTPHLIYIRKIKGNVTHKIVKTRSHGVPNITPTNQAHHDANKAG